MLPGTPDIGQRRRRRRLDFNPHQAGAIQAAIYWRRIALHGFGLPKDLSGTGCCRLRARLGMRTSADERQKPNSFLGRVVACRHCFGLPVLCDVARLMRAVMKGAPFRWAEGALAAASFFYLGILGLLLAMQRFGCCPLVLNF